MQGKIVYIDNKNNKAYIKTKENEKYVVSTIKNRNLKLNYIVDFSQNKEEITINKILKIKVEDFRKLYPISLEVIIQIANKLKIDYIRNDYTIISYEDSQRIYNEWKKQNEKKATQNNPNYSGKTIAYNNRVLIVDFKFATKIFKNVNMSKTLLSIVEKNRIKNLLIILDDNLLYLKEYRPIFDNFKRDFNQKNLNAKLIQVDAKKTNSKFSQRADMLIAGKIGEHSQKGDDIYLLTGDSDFIPVLQNCITTNAYILYYKAGETQETKYSYHLKELYTTQKNIHLLDISSYVVRNISFQTTTTINLNKI